MSATQLFEDRWGAIIDRPDDDHLEIRWFDATADFTTEEFNDWLGVFADHVEQRGRRHVLVDATSFGLHPSKFDMEWRDAHVIPRYNRVGVRKFAFLMPEGMPAIGAPPSPEGPADFPTAYFGRREDALRWLAE